MKNSTRIILVIICFLLIVFLVGILIWGIIDDDFYEGGHFQIVKEETIPSHTIDEIMITIRSSDIQFYSTTSDDIKIIQKSRKNNKKELFQITNTGKTLQIEDSKKLNFCIGFCFFRNSTYEIYVPKSYTGNITVNTTSGDIEFENLEETKLTNLKLVTTSGDIDIKSKLSTSNVKIRSTSGDIEAIALNSPFIELETVSGSISNELIESNQVHLKTVSGEIESRFLKGATQISTVSGDVEIEKLNVTGDSKITTTSGDIDVKMDVNSACQISASSTSGDIHYPKSGTILGSGTNSLYFKTVSGDIDIEVAH